MGIYTWVTEERVNTSAFACTMVRLILVVMVVVQGLVQARVVMPGQEHTCQTGEVCVTMSQCEDIHCMDKTGRLAVLRQSQCGFSGLEPRLCCSLTSSDPFVVNIVNIRTGSVEEFFTEPSVTPVIHSEFWTPDLGPK